MSQIAVISSDELEAIVSRAVQRALPVAEPKNMEKKLLSGKDVEREYGISERNLERWRGEGLGPQYTVIGRRVFYERTLLDAYIKAGRVNTTGEFYP